MIEKIKKIDEAYLILLLTISFSILFNFTKK